jgi:YidC/Oxa1 family membrane protein insertase
MDSQAKRTIITTVVCLVILFGWTKLQQRWYPPPKEVPTSQSQDAGAPVASAPTSDVPGVGTPTSGAVVAARDLTGQYRAINATGASALTLGGDQPGNPYEFALVVEPRGAGVSSARLTGYRNNIAKEKAPKPDPYDLLNPIGTDGGAPLLSFATQRVRLVDQKQTVDLENAIWSAKKTTDETGETAELSTVIKNGESDIARVVKTYRVDKKSPHIKISQRIDNLSPTSIKVVLTQRGPIGLRQSDPQRDERRVVSAVLDESGRIRLGQHAMHQEVIKLENEKEFAQGESHTVWVSVGNKYFAGIVHPEPLDSKAKFASYLSKVSARTPLGGTTPQDDLTFEMTFSPESPIASGQSLALGEDVYLGPKSHKDFESMPAAISRNYDVIYDPERAWCMFKIIASAMLWLLNTIHAVVRNYGLAIIGLVLVVRTILHPVTKRGQVNMMKMQKGMAALKPKVDAIQQQYKNDKQKLNEETMKLYREEGINPAGQMLGCLPLFLQMPVWVALWNTLNTNVDMRHQPFFLWIHDLSAPDALIPFSQTITIPLISALTGPIHALNLLPIIMAITMYTQQKISQKMSAPATPPPKKYDDQGREIPDPMAQQQKMMGFMMIFFGLMFYNLPSGLNLYILTSNLMGMAEQFWIKKQLKRKDEEGGFDSPKKRPPPGPHKPSFFERLQQKAEDARRMQTEGTLTRTPKKKKQPRF